MKTDHSINNSPGKQIGELERLGPGGAEAMVLGVDAPGFADLSPNQRLFAYYLYRAAVAGNAIAYKQCHRDAHQIKQLLEVAYLNSDGLNPDLLSAVHDYLKFVWIHHGQYNHYTHTKYVPERLTPVGLEEAIRHAADQGATLPLADGETLEQTLERLQPSIFDIEYEPIQTNQSEGEDIVAGSAVNYWDPGITSADLDQLDTSVTDKPNIRFAKKGGQIVPELYKTDGVYSHELRSISHFLRLSLEFTESSEQKKSLEALIRHYETGEEEDFREHSVYWLKTNSEVDYLNGFIEVYLDPRGVIGQFEGNVSIRASGGLIDEMADHAGYFEQRMPWPDKYKRTEINRPVANVVNVLVETGDAGPVSPAAYNLPNYNDLRRDHGSKNVILHNIDTTWSEELLKKTVDEFYLPQYRDNLIEYGRTLVRPLEVYMHEIIGHGSGQPDVGLSGDPRTRLGRVYSALEECRADLVALWHIADPKLIEMGAFKLCDQRAVVETMYISFLQGWFSRFDRVPGLEVREAHNKGSHAILMYLVEGGGKDRAYGVEIINENGNYFVRLGDLESVRNGIGDLLRQIQVIKSTGNQKAAEELFDRFGTRLNEDWKQNVMSRKQKLCTPKIKAFVFPRLVPRFENGEIVDVALHNDEDLTAQQLRFSRLENSTSLDESNP